jgi:uncharacterized protein (TIGR00297 family)
MSQAELAARFVLGFASSLLIARLAQRRGSLSSSGAVAAVFIGTSIYLGGGAPWFAVLLTFFGTSTALGRVGKARKAEIKREFEKGDTRDALQAISNGGIAAACALGMALSPSPAWAAAFIGALATANGDTWATELGVLSRNEPFSLLQLRRVPRGTSGAVSVVGVLATLLGGVTVAAIAAARPDAFALGQLRIVLIGALCGVVGSLVDSLLGATLQAGYHCVHCARDTEGPLHLCGQLTQQVRGLPWFNNDMVNLLATLSGAGLAALLA